MATFMHVDQSRPQVVTLVTQSQAVVIPLTEG